MFTGSGILLHNDHLVGIALREHRLLISLIVGMKHDVIKILNLGEIRCKFKNDQKILSSTPVML